jgi:RimJ/RimL family protein N-acetyltransferase
MPSAPAEIHTARLHLRMPERRDLAAFATLNADPSVMRFFPRTWTVDESSSVLQRMIAGFDERGFGAYVVEREGAFAGVVGLSVPSWEAWFTPCVEMLWRLSPEVWGQGFATEAAGAVLTMAFETLRLPEVVAFTIPANVPSIRVMEKIGMRPHDPAFFDHPTVVDPAFKPHTLYHALRPTQSSHQAAASSVRPT